MKRLISTLLLTAALTAGLAACSSDTDRIHVITRENGSGTRNALVYLAGIVDSANNDAIMNTAEGQNTTVAVLSGVETNESAIGYVSFGALNQTNQNGESSQTVKALTIDGFAATIANLESGQYGLQRPFNAVNNGDMSEAAQDFWNFMFSAEGQAVVASREYLVHSDNVNAPAFSTNGASGLVTVGGSTSMAPLMMRLVSAYEEFSGTNARIETHGMGSGAGEIQVAEGAFDIGMVSYEVSNMSLTSGVLAIDGIAVIVNAANTVDNLSLEDLRAVFMGELTRWSEL
jgi:phosphate transport system substrate-binding protein